MTILPAAKDETNPTARFSKPTYMIKEAMVHLCLRDSTIRDRVRRNLLHKSNSVRKIIIKGEDEENFIDRSN